MARRMTPNQKAWQREMLRIENMARSIGIEDVASIKPKTPDKITKRHIAQAEAITMDYVREKAELESAGIKPTKRAKQQKGKAVGGTKKPDYVRKPRRPLTEEEKQQRAENLRRGRESLTHDQLSESAKKGAAKRNGTRQKAPQAHKEKLEQIKNLPRVSKIAVDNFFRDISDRAHDPKPSDDVSAINDYYDAMTDLVESIGMRRFATMLMLADQAGLSVHLELPPSNLDMEWVMGAIMAVYRVVSENNLGYARRIIGVWQDMDERNDSYELEENEGS